MKFQNWNNEVFVRMNTVVTVKEINKDGTVLVGCDNSACAGCHAKMFCNNKNQNEYLSLNTKKIELKEGDLVELFLPPGKTILSTVLVFALPLALFPVGYILGGLIFINEVQKALCGIGFMALAFLIASLIFTRNKRQLMPVVEKVLMKHLNVVGAAIMRDGKLFATQCASKKPEIPFQWEFPGGKIEDGESPQQAISRELSEELSIKVEVKDLITTVSYQYPHFHMTMQIFLCFLDEKQQPKLNEHLSAKWIGPEEFYLLDWAPADVKALDAVASVCWPEQTNS